MRAAQRKARVALVVRAQRFLDEQVGPEAVTKFMGWDLTDRLKRQVLKLAERRLGEEGFAGVWCEVRFKGKLLELVAHGSSR